MTRLTTAALALAIAVGMPLAGVAGNKGCPPGLAKKSPACVPPGQAKKQAKQERYYRVGDRYDDRGYILRDYDRYGLPRPRNGDSYYRLGDNIIRVDDDTRLVLDIISVVSRLSN